MTNSPSRNLRRRADRFGFDVVTMVPVLFPFPHAADDHQLHNARAFAETGAAYLLEQKNATPEKVVQLIAELVEGPIAREKMQTALATWHVPQAAARIAEIILTAIGERGSIESPSGDKTGVGKEANLVALA